MCKLIVPDLWPGVRSLHSRVGDSPKHAQFRLMDLATAQRTIPRQHKQCLKHGLTCIFNTCINFLSSFSSIFHRFSLQNRADWTLMKSYIRIFFKLFDIVFKKCIHVALGVARLEDGKIAYRTNSDLLSDVNQIKKRSGQDFFSYRANGPERKFRSNGRRVIQYPPSSTSLRRGTKSYMHCVCSKCGSVSFSALI